jgi:hypothetical protein
LTAWLAPVRGYEFRCFFKSHQSLLAASAEPC